MISFELRVGKRRTGFAVVPDTKWPGMYRVRTPDGGLSDMVNLSRAKDAAIRWAHLGGDDVPWWDTRQSSAEGARIDLNVSPATMVA